MADLKRLVTALKNADADGDTEGAAVLAKAIRKIQNGSESPAPNSNDPSIPQPMPTVSPAMPPFLQGEKADQSYQSPIWPVSRSPEGNTSFDSNVGILGAIKSGLKVPGDVMAGKLDLNSPEATPRLLEAASLMSPLGVKARAGGATGLVESLAKPKPKIPTQKELEAAAAAGYKQANDLGIEYKGIALRNWARDTIDELNAEFKIAKNNPQVHNLLEEIAWSKTNALPGSETIALGNINELYKVLGKQAGNPDPSIAAAAQSVQKSLERFHSNLSPSDMVSGNTTPQIAAQILKDARGNRAAAYRSETMETLEKSIDRKSSSAGSGANKDNTTRQHLTSLLESRKKSRGLNAAETQAIDDVIKGRRSQNVLRYFGNALGGGGGMMILPNMVLGATAGYTTMGAAGLGAAALPPVLGKTFRSLANRGAAKEVKRIGEFMRSRSPLAEGRKVNPSPLRNVPEPAPTGSPLLAPPQAGPQMTQWPRPTGPVVKGALLGMMNDRTPPAQQLLNPKPGMTEQQIRLLLSRGGA